ncbi:sensor histidine kinase [Maribellus sediminis]|uniref:sensor histidine kinase n=1 Tax=Maribellus sediminis TaxID=2696285 RepID=UPI001430E05E|nr:HAMP domain-containing sensor histidine kinase [Maribellus sediminis]
MNKKLFTALVILMGISILGIITVQLIWMNNAVRVKNEMFDRSVNEAMQRTINRLEDIHNFGVVNDMIFDDDSLHWATAPEIALDLDEERQFWHARVDSESTLKAKRKPIKIIREISPNNKEAVIEIKVENDSDDNSRQTFTYNVRQTTSPAHVVVAGNNTGANSMVFIKKDTIISDADSLYTFTSVKIDSVLMELDTFNVLRPDFSQRVQVKAGNLKRIANKMVSEVSGWDVRQIDETQIFDVLTTELLQGNITLDFEFGIIHDSIADFPMGVSDSLAVVSSAFQANLYPNDIFQKNIKLAVFFPEKGSFIYRSLNWLLVASFMFSLFILMAFALSIFYILRQKKISEMKSDFINNMTHEFKTPIATISVATDSITNDKVVNDPERIRYFAGMIKKENTRMNRQVEDILTIARLDRKEFDFRWETIDVHELIEDAIQGIILQIEKRSGKIEMDFGAVNSVVTTDKIHCTNVVYNLIDNANKYSPDAPEITISTKNTAKGILISVADKGIGMNKVVQAKIFERFYRQTSGNVHNVKGFGLGLSYVKAVIEANKGTISVSSEPGKGSKFDVFLPFVRE